MDTRLGCLNDHLAADSEAMKMIRAANLSFKAINDLENGLPVWKYLDVPLLRDLYRAQDFFTECDTTRNFSSLSVPTAFDLARLNDAPTSYKNN